MSPAPALVYTTRPGRCQPSIGLSPAKQSRCPASPPCFDGAAAAGTFLACLSVYSQDGKLIGRFFPSQQFSVGDSGGVTYGPFLDRAAGGSTSEIIGSSAYVEQAAGFSLSAGGPTELPYDGFWSSDAIWSTGLDDVTPGNNTPGDDYLHVSVGGVYLLQVVLFGDRG